MTKVIHPKTLPAIGNSPFYQKDRNNCVPTAWAVVFGCEYDMADLWCRKFGRKSACGMSIQQVNKMFVCVKKSKIKKGPYTRQEYITINQFTKKHPEGRYFCVVRGHAFAIIDGVVYDHSSGFKKRIIAAWRVHLNKS